MSLTLSDSIADRDVAASDLGARFRRVRDRTLALCAPLEPEDFLLQAMPDASPAKWHVAHTSWFFEAFLLPALTPGYRPVRDDANFLFNSYYNALGARIPRHQRGLMSRPSIGEVLAYREEVDRRVVAALAEAAPETLAPVVPILDLGLNHEQQHQELLLTDLKVAFALNPTRPVYRPSEASEMPPAWRLGWVEDAGGVREIGHRGDGFAFDNESPRHRVFLEPFALADRLATNGEYLAFLADGGYERPELWLSDGWATARAEGWNSPMYWERRGDRWETFTLSGMHPVSEAEPVVHVSYYEADAFARWADARLPTEAEWEVVAEGLPMRGNFAESDVLHPVPAPARPEFAPSQMAGDVWEWTASPYVAYPGFRPAAGAIGEYNGKFMCNQFILRGGSCVTPGDHVRASYRNFFPPGVRWQFSGIRLAR